MPPRHALALAVATQRSGIKRRATVKGTVLGFGRVQVQIQAAQGLCTQEPVPERSSAMPSPADGDTTHACHEMWVLERSDGTSSMAVSPSVFFGGPRSLEHILILGNPQ